MKELLYQSGLDALKDSAGRAAAINARADSILKNISNRCTSLTLLQHFKPEHDALLRLELPCSSKLEGEYELILLIPSKNKQQTLGWMAEAMINLVNGGKLIVCCANKHGARSYENALKELAGNIDSTSKFKCRLFSAQKSHALDIESARVWVAEARPQKIESHGLISQPGLFSWDRPDIGSQLLLEQLPDTLHGKGMDLGCGYGFLSTQLLKSSPGIETLHLVEADRLALHCAGQNTRPWQEMLESHWLDALADPLPLKLDWIVCNPPFHTGQDQDISLGQTIIANGCKSLKPGGRLFMVANRKLPYEAVLDRMLMRHQIVTQEQGFKIIEAVK